MYQNFPDHVCQLPWLACCLALPIHCLLFSRGTRRKKRWLHDGSIVYNAVGNLIACWLKRWTRNERLQVWILAGAVRKLSSPESTLCADSLLSVRSTPMLPQWHVKDPGHSAQSADDKLHLNTHTPLTQRSRSGLTMLLSRHSVGTYQETSWHATHQGTFGHSHLSLLSHIGIILTSRVELVWAS